MRHPKLEFHPQPGTNKYVIFGTPTGSNCAILGFSTMPSTSNLTNHPSMKNTKPKPNPPNNKNTKSPHQLPPLSRRPTVHTAQSQSTKPIGKWREYLRSHRRNDGIDAIARQNQERWSLFATKSDQISPPSIGRGSCSGSTRKGIRESKVVEWDMKHFGGS